MTEAQTLPHNLDAEESVLGACMASQDSIASVSAILNPEDFYVPANGLIYEAELALFRKRLPVDPITVSEEIQRRGQLEEIGGKFTLANLMGSFDIPSSAPFYARIVAENAQLRGLIQAGMEVCRIGYERSEDVASAVAEAEKVLFQSIQSRNTRQRAVNVTPLATAAMERLETQAQELHEAQKLDSNATPGFRIGLPSVDEMIGGIQEAMYVCIGAKTSIGKTSLLTQIVTSAARSGRKVLHFSLEMPSRQVIHRIWAQSSGVPVHRFTNPALLEDEDWVKVVDTTAALPYGIWIADGSFSIVTLLSEVRRLQIEQGSLDVVVVDYVQLVRANPDRKHRRRDEELSEISQAFKALANDTGITVIIAAQLSREHEREKRRPNTRDLRDSGSLEHDPDVVMFLHRPEPKKSEPQLGSMKPTEVIIAKHRNGPTGLREVTFDSPHNRFIET